jgi:hypothetical protein
MHGWDNTTSTPRRLSRCPQARWPFAQAHGHASRRNVSYGGCGFNRSPRCVRPQAPFQHDRHVGTCVGSLRSQLPFPDAPARGNAADRRPGAPSAEVTTIHKRPWARRSGEEPSRAWRLARQSGIAAKKGSRRRGLRQRDGGVATTSSCRSSSWIATPVAVIASPSGGSQAGLTGRPVRGTRSRMPCRSTAAR